MAAKLRRRRDRHVRARITRGSEPMFLVSKTTRYRSFLALLGFVGSKAAVCRRRKLSARMRALMMFLIVEG